MWNYFICCRSISKMGKIDDIRWKLIEKRKYEELINNK